jgi:4-amino-4-deoxy-L-arabinose transferase-like glycosyltransferase
MSEFRLSIWQTTLIMGLSGVCLFTFLGGSGRLSYHEAIWAQSAREMVASGDVWVPTLDGRPWLEKPPLGIWPIAACGWLLGRLNEAAARMPSALAATVLAIGVGVLAARRFGATVGLISGCAQATSIWLVMRGRLAEVDIVLACLVTWPLVVFDRLRCLAAPSPGSHTASDAITGTAHARAPTSAHPGPANPLLHSTQGPTETGYKSLCAFFTLLGATALAKGVGFGAALVLATVGLTLLWDRDRATTRRLIWFPGIALAIAIALAWPVVMVTRYPSALNLWMTHITDRLSASSEQFAGEPFWGYALSYFWQTLPWTPLAILFGLWPSWRRASRQPSGLDRLLWAWAVVPAALVSLASVRNAHYLIYALPPWSIWGALGFVRLGERLRTRGWSIARVRWSATVVFSQLAVLYAVSFGWLNGWYDRRGPEWAFYEQAGRQLAHGESLTLIYDWPYWDRFPYSTPFGPVPHDLAVRLFYLDRPTSWCLRAQSLAEDPPSIPFAIIGREHDAERLRAIGQVKLIVRGPSTRSDRAYALYRVFPRERPRVKARAREKAPDESDKKTIADFHPTSAS